MGKTIWGLFYIGVENDAAGHVIEPQGSPRGQGPPRFGCCELAQQADEPQMGKTIWGLFYVWVKMMLLRCEIEPQGKAFQIRTFRRPR